MTTLWNYTKRGLRIVMGRVPAGRSLSMFPDDVFLISYPRSGNTWMRFLLGNLIYPEDPITFANIESRVPEVYLFADRVLRQLPRPRILKSHEYFDPRYRKMIYIVRDPRDVLVSMYHYHIKRRNFPDGYPMAEFASLFVAGSQRLGFWGSWGQHVKSWLDTHDSGNDFLVLHYEDMLQDPRRELARIAKLLNIEPAAETLNRAVELSSAERMRSLEKQESQEWIGTKQTRQDKPFVRSATSGSWREIPDHSCLSQIEAAWAPLMRKLGYAPMSGSSRESILPEPAGKIINESRVN